MSLFSFSNNKKGEEVSAVFHIGSGSVDGHLVRLSKISKPEIIYSISAPISFQKDIKLERHFKLMIKAFDSMLKDLTKEGLKHLNFTGLRNHGLRNAFFILSSPWCVSQTKIIKIKKDKPFEISGDLIESIIREQEDKFLSNDSTEGSKVIEKRIIEAKLNGYKMAEIYGKKTKDAEFSLFMTSAPEYVLKELRDTAQKYFNFRSSHFHSFALCSFSAIRDIYSDIDDFIYLDVHGELTDLSIIKDNVFVESASFPAGKNFFARKISEKLRVSVIEAYSLINMHAKGKCDSATSLKVETAIDESLKDWLERFHSVLTSLSLNMYVPRTIFMIASDEFSAFLLKKLKEEKFSQFSMTEESFDVIVLDTKNLCEYCKSDKNFKKEPFAEMECIFLNKLFNTK
ncbi:MAG: hypothetical protein HW401_471 [Parcubacteria group bacterium]|nr:hypothetical protein [Parcubacteria group bacterium]